MTLSVWLDVAIGLAVIYVGASLFATVLNEYVAQLFNLRGSQLLRSLLELIDDQVTVKVDPHPGAPAGGEPPGEERLRAALARIPAFASLFPAGGASSRKTLTGAVSYVDPSLLARAVVSLVFKDQTRELEATALAIPATSPLRPVLLSAVRLAGQERRKLVAEVTTWLDRSLAALGEQYKRNLQKLSLLVGFLMAGLLNLDTVTIVDTLYRDKAMRDAAVTLGELTAQSTNPQDFESCVNGLDAGVDLGRPTCGAANRLMAAVRTGTDDAGALPVGWAGPRGRLLPSAGESGFALWASRLLGWLLTAFAVSLGAPFWFDLLSRFVNIRHSMRKPDPEVAGEE